MANCPYCKRYFSLKQPCLDHINKYHAKELEASGMDAAQSLYYSVHKTLSGKCMCGCGRDTEWNYKTGKPYKVSTDPECKKRLYTQAEKNMMSSRGVTVHSLLQDMEHQKEMQEHRPTYGHYKFSTGGEVNYLSKLELNFLKFCDLVMEFTANMFAPCPEAFEYFDPETNTTRKYMPDYYLPDYNLIIEIKDGGKKHNTNPAYLKQTGYKVALKDEVMKNQNRYNYIRISGANYGSFVELLYQIVHDSKPETKKGKNYVIITESTEQPVKTPTTIPTELKNYLLVVYEKDTMLPHQIGITKDCELWYITDLDTEELKACDFRDLHNILYHGTIVSTYKYAGNKELFDMIWRVLGIVSASSQDEGANYNILTLMANSGITFDDGIGKLANNPHKQSMFIPIKMIL